MLPAAPAPAARGSAACPGGLGRQRPPSSPGSAARVSISPERGLVFWFGSPPPPTAKALFITVSMNSSVRFALPPHGTPRRVLLRGRRDVPWNRESAHLSRSALQIRAAWLLCEPPQVAVIFLKGLSMAAVSSLANSLITQHQLKHVCSGFQAAPLALPPLASSLLPCLLF